MMIRLQAFSFAAIGCIAVSAIIIVAMPTLAHAQSADLVLCDRLAADPSDPDKPADVKGTPDVAAADVATAIKYCKMASASSRRALYQLGRAYAANRQLPEAMAAWRKAADKGSTSAMVELGVAMARALAWPGTNPRRENCSSAPLKPAIRAASPISPHSPAVAAARRRIPRE